MIYSPSSSTLRFLSVFVHVFCYASPQSYASPLLLICSVSSRDMDDVEIVVPIIGPSLGFRVLEVGA